MGVIEDNIHFDKALTTLLKNECHLYSNKLKANIVFRTIFTMAMHIKYVTDKLVSSSIANLLRVIEDYIYHSLVFLTLLLKMTATSLTN